MENKTFHASLKEYMDEYAHLVYETSRKFPKQELFGLTSQIRRASLSVILNYIEGYGRMRSKVYKNFLEISFGSLQESKYLVQFSFDEQFLSEDNFKKLNLLANKIGAMLWGIITKI